MNNILLIQPPIQDFYFTAKRTIPYGLVCIAGALREQGFCVDIFDCLATNKSKILDLPENMEYLHKYYGRPDLSPFSLFHQYKHYGYSFEYIGKIAKESKAFLIGISSLFTAYSNEAIETAKIVKKFNPNCKIVFGGHHPTALPKEVMECQYVDFIIRGEGEVGMPLLAKAVKKEISFESVPGIVFRKNNGSLYISNPCFMQNLDKYPVPALDLIKHKFYKRNKKGSATIVTSRGCPMACSYCCVTSSFIKYRQKKVESVIAELEEYILQYNARFIDFEDENLSLSKKWFLHLLDEIKKKFGQYDLELRAMNGLFPPSLDEEIIIKMKQAGFKTLNLSLGTISKKQLIKFNRHDVRLSLENVLNIASKHGLDTVCYIIVGAPDQKPEDSITDLLFLAKNRTIAGVSVFYPAPGSKYFDFMQANNMLPQSFSLMRSSTIPVSNTTTRLETITLMRLGRILNFIKSLIKEKIPLPDPCACRNWHFDKNLDKKEIAIKLLSYFLYDGIIRGVNLHGEIYSHLISLPMTQQFLYNIQDLGKLGGKKGSFLIRREG